MNMCEIDGCSKPKRSKRAKWCEMHYYRNRRHGNPHSKITQQYSIDECLFKKIDSDEKAWLLGVLFTDGWLDINTIGIKSKDKQLIEECSRVFKTDQKIKIAKTNGRPYYYLSLSNKYMANNLRSLGMFENKSLSIQYPEKLEDNLFWSFFRGVIDGDGSIQLNNNRKNQRVADCRVVLCGASVDFMKSIGEQLTKRSIMYSFTTSENNRKNPVYYISIAEHDSLRKIFNSMYSENGVPCLHRKKQNLCIWYNTPRVRSGRPTNEKKSV
jgi:hypothetical protein